MANYNVSQIELPNKDLLIIKDTTARTNAETAQATADSKVTIVSWDATNKKLTKTINGSTTDIVAGSTILSGLTKAQVTSALGYTPPTEDTNTTYSLTQDSTDKHKFTLSGTDGSSVTVTIPDNNTTYTFAESTTNGAFTVTPSGKSAQTVKIHGLGNAAYKGILDTYSSTSTDAISGKGVAAALASLPTPMVFKGSLGTGGTITTLPTASASNNGHSYKVITNGTYAGVSAKAGDMFISDGTQWVYIPSADEPSGTVTSVGITNGGGLSVSGSPITTSGTITISHADTSSQASVNNSGRTYIQDISLDTYGHVTGITSATETVVDTNTTYAIGTSGNNITLTPSSGSAQSVTAPYATKALNNKDGESITATYRRLDDPYYDTVYATEEEVGDLIVTGAARFLNTINGSITGNAATATNVAWSGVTGKPTTLGGYGITDAKIANGVITLGSNTITPLTSHQTVTNKGATLAWKTTSTIATIGGTDIKVTMPDNPNTNTTYTLGADTKNNKITLTPSSGDIQSITVPYATSAGSAGSATKATQDGSGNVITSTYLPLSGGTMTGQINLASSALKTNESTGWTMNQYGNLVHQRATTTDYWAIANNTGTYKFQVYYETGAVTAAGNITAPKFIGALQGNADTATLLNQDTTYKEGTAYVCQTSAGTVKAFCSRANNSNIGVSTNSYGCMLLSATWGGGTSYNGELFMGMGDFPNLYFRGKNNGTYTAWKAIGQFTATPTSDQVVITDGTTGGMKSSGYTIATSVPSGAKFTDTKNTAGSTDTSSKIFLIGATSQAANPQTYSQDTAYVGTDGCLYSGGSKVLTAHQDISGKVSKTGDTMSGGLTVEASNSYSSYNEGIRINAGARTYATLLIGGTAGTTSGTNDGAFWLGVYNTGTTARRLMIAHNGSTATTTYFYTNANNTVTPSLRIGADLQVDGGTYVKSINYIGTKATTAMIRFIDNTTDAYGNGIYIGGGGQTVIGGGESASVAAANLGNSGAEVMYITNDNGNICFVPNTDSGWANRKESYFSANGDLFVNNSVHAVVYGVSPTNGTTGGISLYGGASYTANYGIAFRRTGTGTGEMGKHGYVQGDWATYFTMDGTASNRGWVFRHARSGNVASITADGNQVLNGSLTIGGNTTNTSGVRQVYDSNTKSLNFIFVA